MQVRTDKNLSGFLDLLFVPDDGAWKHGSSNQQVECAVRFSLQLIEFMCMIFTELTLVLHEKRRHRSARLWCLMFPEWAKTDAERSSGRSVIHISPAPRRSVYFP